MCGVCQQRKKAREAKAQAAAQGATYKVRLINHSETALSVVGAASGTPYGAFKNGDRIRIRIEDYEAEPEKFVRL